eukprot:g1978.t1
MIRRKIIASLSSSTDSGVGRFADAFMGILERRGISSPKPSKRYIPVNSRDLRKALARASRDFYQNDSNAFFSFYANVELYFRFKLLKVKDEVKSQYKTFSPETSGSGKSREKALEKGNVEGVASREEFELLENLHLLADHANYDRLDDEWIEESLRNPDRDGVSIKQVDRRDFTTLRVWVRGRSRGEKISARKGLQKKFMDAYDLEIRSKEADSEETFDRVLAAVRRRGDPQMRLMLFENVPTSQVELVMPQIEVFMQMKDKLL